VQAIKDLREREQLFNEHMKEREKKEKEARRTELKKKKSAFQSFLEANKSIKVILLTPMKSAENKQIYTRPGCLTEALFAPEHIFPCLGISVTQAARSVANVDSTLTKGWGSE